MNKMEKNYKEEYDKEMCIREINDNIRRVFNDEPLTKPLSVLRNNCDFKKRYDIAFDLRYNVRKCLNCRKEFKDVNEEGCCSDTCKDKRKEYYEKNKDKISEKRKEYYEKNKDKYKEYYEKNKDKLSEKAKERYGKKKE